MNANGSEQTRLTNNATDEAYPVWSPDGTKIAFMTSHNGAPDIYVMNADGSDIKRLTDHRSQDVLSAWSPDGMQIAFASDRDDGVYVNYIMNADGSDQRPMPMQVPEKLKPPLGLTGFAVWSPDGQRIAFEGGTWEDTNIYVINADGSGLAQVTTAPGTENHPGWSPDGSKLSFVSARDGGSVYTINPDGSGETQLVSQIGTSNDPLVPAPWVPGWSPDGKHIVYVSDGDKNLDIWVMSPDGTEQRNLTQHPGADTTPAWQP